MYQVNNGITHNILTRQVNTRKAPPANLNFTAEAPRDVFVQTNCSKPEQQKISFGWFQPDPAKKLIAKNPDLRHAVDAIIAGDAYGVDQVNAFLEVAIPGQDLQSEDVKALTNHISKKLVKSVYIKPTEGKAEALTRLHELRGIINDRLNAYNDYAKSFRQKFFAQRTRHKAAEKIAQTRIILNDVLAIKDDSLREKGRDQIKATLIDAINNPRLPEFARDHALHMLFDGEFVDSKTTLFVFKRQIEKTENFPFLQYNAIKYMPEAIGQFIRLTEEKGHDDYREDIVLSCIATLQNVLTSKAPGKMKRAAEASIDEIALKYNIGGQFKLAS